MKYKTACSKRFDWGLEAIPPLYAIMFGLWLLMPWDTFTSSGIFGLMGSVAPEWVWGSIILLAGAAQIASMIIGRIKICLITSLLLMFLFISLAIFSFVGNFKSTATPSLLVMAYASWLSYGELLITLKGKE